MIDWKAPYERTEQEYQAAESLCLAEQYAPVCLRCGEKLGYHWQTADGKIWCVRNAQTVGADA